MLQNGGRRSSLHFSRRGKIMLQKMARIWVKSHVVTATIILPFGKNIVTNPLAKTEVKTKMDPRIRDAVVVL